MKVKKVVKRWRKRAVKSKGKGTPDQNQGWEFDNFIRERLRSIGVIE